MRTTRFQRLTAGCLAVGIAVLPSIAIGAPNVMYWERVDFYFTQDGRGEKAAARLILDPGARQLTVADEKRPELATFATVPYDIGHGCVYDNVVGHMQVGNTPARVDHGQRGLGLIDGIDIRFDFRFFVIR